MPESDSRYVLGLGVFGDRALDLMRLMVKGAAFPRRQQTGYVAADDLRCAANGEVTFDLSGFKPRAYVDFSHDSAVKIRKRIADLLLIDTRNRLCDALKPNWKDFSFATLPVARLRNSRCAGVMVDGAPLRERLCLIEAIRGADRLSLVQAYGEDLACAVCGTQAQADPLAAEIIKSIRRHIYALRERQMAERSALRERGRREEREMDDRQRSEIAEAEASLRRLHGDGLSFE